MTTCVRSGSQFDLVGILFETFFDFTVVSET